MGKPTPVPYVAGDDPDEDEEKSVHEVYERIAPHFSQTRYKPWPLIESFLLRLPPHAVGLDSGAGNGKYIPAAKSAGAEVIAMDRSIGLLGIAKGHGGDCVRGDLCGRGWRDGVFDFAISIAAIHHLSTPLRRRLAVQALIAPLHLSAGPSYSRFLVYVWAYEQGKNSKRRMGQAAPIDKLSHTTDSAGTESSEEKVQDVLVPWVLQKPGESSKPKRQPPRLPSGDTGAEAPPTKAEEQEEEKAEVYHRYYHLFTSGELRGLVEEAAEAEGFDLLPSSSSSAGVDEAQGDGGEERPPGRRKFLRVTGEGWEADNWWLEGEVGLL